MRFKMAVQLDPVLRIDAGHPQILALAKQGNRCRTAIQETPVRYLAHLERGRAGIDPLANDFIHFAPRTLERLALGDVASRHHEAAQPGRMGRDPVPAAIGIFTLEFARGHGGQLGVTDDITPGFLHLRLVISVCSPADPMAVDEIVRKSLKFSPLMDVLARAQSMQTHIELAQLA